MAQSNQIIEIFKARGNLLKQLSKQGFNVEDYEGSNINEVNLMFLEKQMDMLVTNPKTSQKTYVKYHKYSMCNLVFIIFLNLRDKFVKFLFLKIFKTRSLPNHIS